MGMAGGVYTVTSIAYISTRNSARMLPPREIGPALRKAAQDRDARVVTVAVAPQPTRGADVAGADTLAAASFSVASPELLGKPLALALLTFAASLLALAICIMLVSLELGVYFAPTADGPPSSASDIASILWVPSIFLTLAGFAFVGSWRLGVSWQTRIRGARVTLSAEGLAVRDHATLWRPRFIPWREVVSIVQFIYNDSYTRSHIVYLLDAGNQTFLWESPPDMRYVSPAILARVAARQESAARLLTYAAEATGLPLLNITGVVSEVAKIEPDPSNMSGEPDSRDVALLDFIEGVTSTKGAEVAPSTTAEKWRKILVNVLVVIAVGFALWAWYGSGLGF
jgi:hypothetical protein